MASVYADTRHWRLEKLFYRLMGAQPDDRQRWTKYCTSVLAFSAVSVLFLYGLLLAQTLLPEAWGHRGMTPALAFNTAISFVTNTSWQNYPGETTLGHVGLLAGLGVQAFVSCAVGMCVAVALIRGLSQYRSEQIGNFWGDLMGTVVRILIPLSIVVTLILLALGVVNNLHGAQDITTLAGGRSQTILGDPVATWESIKLMSGDGGGAFNVNSAHPFENPKTAHQRRGNCCDALDSGRIHQNLRGDGRRQETRLGAICRSGNPIRDWHRSDHHGGSRSERHRDPRRRSRDRRHRDPLRRARQRHLWSGRDRQRRRRCKLLLRQLRQCRRSGADAEHDAWRSGTRRCGQGTLRLGGGEPH